MNIIDQLKSISWGSNTLYDFMLSLGAFVLFLIILKLIQLFIVKYLKKLAEKTKTDYDDVLIEIVSKVKPPFYLLIALFLALQFITMSDIVYKIIKLIFLITIVVEVVRAIERFLDFFISKYIKKIEKQGNNQVQTKSMVASLKVIIRVFLWIIAITLVLANLGVEITSLVASLGIGGIAIALAVQNILGDLFSSFTIYLDKPFKVGDFIVIGQDSGTVEKIGLKTTRIRTLQGEEMVISNKELTTVRVQNFKQLEKRRIIFNIGVTYGTPQDKLEKIPKILEEIITKVDKVVFERCVFDNYGDFSLNFEIVYLVESSKYMDAALAKQEINYELYRRFNKEGIEFAFPTQTVQVVKES